MATHERRKLKKMYITFFEPVDYLVIYKCRPCWSGQLYPLDKHSQTLDSVLGICQSDKVQDHFGHVRKLAGGIH